MVERGPAAQALIDLARGLELERNKLRSALQKIHDHPNCRHEVEMQIGDEVWDGLKPA